MLGGIALLNRVLCSTLLEFTILKDDTFPQFVFYGVPGGFATVGKEVNCSGMGVTRLSGRRNWDLFSPIWVLSLLAKLKDLPSFRSYHLLAFEQD